MSEMKDYFDKVDARFDRIESKLDNYLERTARNEEAIQGMKGQIKIVLSTIIGVLTAAVAALFDKLGGFR